MSGLLLHSTFTTATVLLGGMGKLNQTSILLSNSKKPMTMRGNSIRTSCNNSVTSFLFNPAEDPVLKQAFKEPIAFAGGLFAGLLRLDLNEDPLKEWVTRTVESAGFTEEIDTQESVLEEGPTEIEIE